MSRYLTALMKLKHDEKGVIPIALFADLIDRLSDPGKSGERGEAPGFVT